MGKKAPEQEPEEDIYAEKKRIHKLSQIREVILGAQDGLLGPLGVMTSVAIASQQNHFVILAGISSTLASALSLATGVYLSSQAETQVYKKEIRKEMADIKQKPQEQQEELAEMYEHDGLSEQDAKNIVTTLARSTRAFSYTVIQKGLGLDLDNKDTALTDTFFVASSCMVSSCIPLIPYLFAPVRQAMPFSIGLTLLALFIVGVVKAKYASMSYLTSGLQVVGIGAISGLIGYLLGEFIPKLLRF